MNLGEVINSFTDSISINSPSSIQIVNLLGMNKAQKAKAVEEAFYDYIRGKDSIIILSVTTSSKLFQFILKHVPKLFFVEKRVIQDGKRRDAIALLFTH